MKVKELNSNLGQLSKEKIIELERIVVKTDNAESWQSLEKVFNHDIQKT